MKPIVIDGPRMSDITGPGETTFLAELVTSCLGGERPILGVHLWTHSPSALEANPVLTKILERLRDASIPVAFQVTITGLGGTILEPGIEPTEEAFSSLERILDKGLLGGPDRICLRVDPLQAWQGPGWILSNTDWLDPVLERARALGIRRTRVSLICYDRYRARIQPRERARGLKAIRTDPAEVVTRLRNWLRQGVEIRTCATDLAAHGIQAAPCFDFTWVTGLPHEGEGRAVAPRAGCLCSCPESVRLVKIPRRSACKGRCMACYAQEHL